MYSKTISALIFYLFIYLFIYFFWGGGGGEDGRLFEAGRLLTFPTYRVGAYSRWALIRGWALNRINTVFAVLNSVNAIQFHAEVQNQLNFYAATTTIAKWIKGKKKMDRNAPIATPGYLNDSKIDNRLLLISAQWKAPDSGRNSGSHKPRLLPRGICGSSNLC